MASGSIRLGVVQTGLFSAACLLITGCGDAPRSPVVEGLRPKVTARQMQISSLKGVGVCSEISSGMLRRATDKNVSLEERTLIEQENFDREKIFSEISKVCGIAVSDVKALFVKMQ